MQAHCPKLARNSLAAVLTQLPPVQHAFAYGSGIFHQPGLYKHGGTSERPASSSQPMLDFFLAVEDPLKWHMQVCYEENYRLSAPYFPAMLALTVLSRLLFSLFLPSEYLQQPRPLLLGCQTRAWRGM
jgi:hypothetical protein